VLPPAAPSSDAAHSAGHDPSPGERAALWANLAGRVRHSLIGSGVVGLGERRFGPTSLAERAVRSPGSCPGRRQVALQHPLLIALARCPARPPHPGGPRRGGRLRHWSGHTGRLRHPSRRVGRPNASGGAYAAGVLSSSRGPPLPPHRHTQAGTTTTDPASLAELITLARYGGACGRRARCARRRDGRGSSGGTPAGMWSSGSSDRGLIGARSRRAHQESCSIMM
jgi:hypothetical protein